MALKHSTLTPKHSPRHRQANQATPPSGTSLFQASPHGRHNSPPAETQSKSTRQAKKQSTRAGEGNRTLTTSLEGWSSAIELHPHKLKPSTPAQTAQYTRQSTCRPTSIPAQQPHSQFNQTSSKQTRRKTRPIHQPQLTPAATQPHSSKNAPAEPKDRPTRTMLCSATATGKLKMFALTGQNNRQPNQLPIQQTSLTSDSGRENIRARPVPNQP